MISVDKVTNSLDSSYDKYVVHYALRKREFIGYDALPKTIKRFLDTAKCEHVAVGDFDRFTKEEE